VKSALAISGVFNLFEAARKLADGSEPLAKAMQHIVMNGLISTEPEKVGEIAELWLDSKIDSTQFSEYLMESCRGNPTIFDDLSPVENVMAIFKKVVRGDYSGDDLGFMVQHYLKKAAECAPSQVVYVKNMKCSNLATFAEHVFNIMFTDEKIEYVDTQVAFLLQVGGADALAERMRDYNPHVGYSWATHGSLAPLSRSNN